MHIETGNQYGEKARRKRSRHLKGRVKRISYWNWMGCVIAALRPTNAKVI